MAKYRRKPVVIEAIQFDPYQQPWPDGVISWDNFTSWEQAGVQPKDGSWGCVQTLEGPMHVMTGDWIITGVAGEKYPCKPHVFFQSYEPVEEEGQSQMIGNMMQDDDPPPTTRVQKLHRLPPDDIDHIDVHCRLPNGFDALVPLGMIYRVFLERMKRDVQVQTDQINRY